MLLLRSNIYNKISEAGESKNYWHQLFEASECNKANFTIAGQHIPAFENAYRGIYKMPWKVLPWSFRRVLETTLGLGH